MGVCRFPNVLIQCHICPDLKCHHNATQLEYWKKRNEDMVKEIKSYYGINLLDIDNERLQQLCKIINYNRMV